MPHQREAVRFALERNRCYLGLDPGLGKTLCAAMVASVICHRTIYISPPFLVLNIVAEFKRWTPELKTEVFKTTKKQLPVDVDVWVVPDTLLAHPRVAQLIREHGTFEERTMVVDEAHRFKNKDARRTKALLGSFPRRGAITAGLFDLCARHVFMSGTPIPNRPMELHAVLAKAAPETIARFESEFAFGVKYCAGFNSPWGWDFTGASNVAELAAKVKAPTGPFMLRQRKSLLKLPPKTERVFILSAAQTGELSSLEKVIRKKYSRTDDLMRAGFGDDVHLMSYRRMLGLEKAKAIIPYIRSLLDETREKLILFAYHREALTYLVDALKAYKPLTIMAHDKTPARQAVQNTFQNDLSRRVIIGSYRTMGLGFTLTAATREIFVEFDWDPSVNDQASDRAHRIGQTRSVIVEYVVHPGSIDQSVIEANVHKRNTTNQV